MKNKEYPYYSAPDLKNLQQLISYCADTYGEKTAFHFMSKKKEIKKSYKDFFEDITAFSRYLISKGYKRTHIALLGENSYEWLVSYFAIVNSDNVVVPLDKEMRAAELSSIVKSSDSSVIIFSPDYEEEAVFNEGLDFINMNSLRSIIEENTSKETSSINFFDGIEIDNEAVCAIVYTSGTTSEPKGVMLNHKNIVSDAVYSAMNSRIPDTSVLVLPLHHTYAITIAINLPLIYGTSIFINQSLRNLMSDIAYCKPGYIAVVPLMLEIFYKKIIASLEEKKKLKTVNHLLNLRKFLNVLDLETRRKIFSGIIDAFGGNLRLIAVGGAPINGAIVDTFICFGINVSSGYGTSECSPIVSFVRDKHYSPYSSGTVLPGVETRIVDKELQIKGDIVFLGYYKDEKATKEVFSDGWYKTGDLAYMKENFLFITGRLNNLIVLSNGENISPESMEMMLHDNIPEIEDVIVYSIDNAIVAEIYISSPTPEIKDKVNNDIDKLNKTLPVYKQITKIIFRETEFEKTTTKKIKRTH